MSLTIGIDARELESRPRGVGRVLGNLLKEWSKKKLDHRFVLYFKNHIPALDVPDSFPCEKKLLPVPGLLRRNRIWEQVYLPKQIQRDAVEVFLSPSYTLPLRSTCPMVVMVHDISFQSHPEWYSFRERALICWLTRRSVKRAAKVICCSRFTRDELLKHYGSPLTDKTRVVYYAPEGGIKTGSAVEAKELLAAKFDIYQPYFLFVGSFFKRRNIPLLIHAFRKVLQAHPDYLLVLIGSDTEQGEEIKNLARTTDLFGKVLCIRFIEEEDLTAFYQAAYGFVYPSSYEGFGLPVVEAMACGIPAIILDAQAMVELYGGASLVVEQCTEDELAQAMTALIENANKREDLIQKGLIRAGEFSWQKAASSVMEIMEEAAGS